MQQHRGTGRAGREADPMPERRPRVVILDADGAVEVEILELADDLRVGTSFRHHGTVWTVTGERRGSRVLYATAALA